MVSSSHGNYSIDEETGEILVDQTDEFYDIEKFDLEEFKKYYGYLCQYYDILDLGYWTNSGEYEHPVQEHRDEIKKHNNALIVNEEVSNIFKGGVYYEIDRR